MLNANEILFRSSGIGYLMTEPRSKSEKISEGTKTHLIDVFVSNKYGRKEDIKSKFLDKGNEREEDAITLLSRITKQLYSKNETHLSNEFIKGTPDLFKGESINNATATIDTKTSWSAHTFFRAQKSELEKMYYWQGQAYMALTGARTHTVAYCLVNGAARAIMDEKRKLAYVMNCIDGDSPEYIEKCKQIEINHIFDMKAFKEENPFFEIHNKDWSWDIPKEERLFQFTFERSMEDIVRMYQKIKDCREWMNENLFKTFKN